MNTYTITTTATALAMTMVIALLSLTATPAAAQTPGDMEASVSGMTATVSFTRSTPCAPYTINWGDETEEVVEDISEICIQMIDEKTVRHTYEEEGEYTITLTLGEEEYSEEVSVPGEEISFVLSDVESVTSRWVDPFEMMADEEYYVYTITLEDDTEVMVEVPGFTLEEYRIEQFRNAGYTGDIEPLIAMAKTEGGDEEPEAPETEDEDVALYQELISTLQSLITAMQSLLDLRQT